jgi:hypothetical protein
MRGKLNRRSRRWFRGGKDRGGVAVLLAVVLGGGVLLGIGGVVIDVGQLYVERGELQTGADAAAEAVAKACAAGHCTTDPVVLARKYAGLNAKDGAADVSVCGSGINGLPQCAQPSGSAALTQCMGSTPVSTPGTTPARYVEVRTTTRNQDGSTVMPPTLARTLAGNSSYQGTKVGACARALATPGLVGRVWEANSIALTVNVCYWSMYTKNGASYPGTVTTPPAAAKEQVLYLKDSRPNGDGSNNTTYCPGNLGDANAPGNWGWLDDTTGANDCRAVFTTGTTISADPGNNTPGGCGDLLSSLRAGRQPLLIPLFDNVSGTGNNTRYHLAGFGAWVVTGYHLTGGGNKESSWLSNRNLCSGSERCIYGYFVDANFTRDVLKVENGTDFGAKTNLPASARLIG